MRQLICLAALVALCLLPLQAEAADGIRTYGNRNGGYSVAYPEGWRAVVGDWNRSVNIVDNSGESLSVIVIVAFYDKSKTVDTMSQSEISDFTLSLVQGMHLHLPAGMTDFTVDDFGIVLVGGRKAVYVATTAEWDNAGKSRQSKNTCYYLLRDGDLYVIATDAVPAAAGSFKAVFQKSLDSFKFL